MPTLAGRSSGVTVNAAFQITILLKYLTTFQVTGELVFDRQYHFYMETAVCRVECTEENGFKIESATQLQTFLQQSLSYTFSMPAHK